MIIILGACNSDKSDYVNRDDEVLNDFSYVGVDSCIECHQVEYEKWRGSHHDLAMQVANDSTVLGDFNNVRTIIDGVSYFFYRENDEFFVNIKEIDSSETSYKIAYTFGITPLQQYMVDFDKGKVQVLRATWDVIEKKWYHQYAGDRIAPDDWLHWTRGAQNWNTMCAECHSTNLEKNYHIDSDSFETTFSEINVSCESCHGPSSRHVEWAQEEPRGENTYILSGMMRQDQLNICAPCHSRRSKLTPNLVPGEVFENQYMIQNLSTNYYHGDGQIDEEDYVYGSFLQSKMYANGVMCSNCHDSHSMKLKYDGNSLCLQCHLPAKYTARNHSFHEKDTEADLCINCHMTGVTYMGNDFRRDHSFRVPRPDQSLLYGTPNACVSCHDDKDNHWAARAIEEWYGDTRPDHFSDKLLLSATNELTDSERQSLNEFINDLNYPAIARSTVIENLGFYNEEDFNGLMTALKDSSAIVRYNALMKFRYLTPQERTSVALDHLNDSIRLVRIAAAQLLIGFNENTLNKTDRLKLVQARSELDTMLYSNADFSAGRMQLGDHYLQRNDLNRAIEQYTMALKMDSLLIPLYSNLATSYAMIQDYGNAEKLLSIWEGLEPDNGRPHYLKALLFFETGNDEKAVNELKKAIEIDPEDSRSMYNLATYYYQGRKDLSLAESYCQSALRSEPGNLDYKYLLGLIFQEQGESIKAQRIFQELNVSQQN
jgi:predicted CXXCH cytochrome family protein